MILATKNKPLLMVAALVGLVFLIPGAIGLGIDVDSGTISDVVNPNDPLAHAPTMGTTDAVGAVDPNQLDATSARAKGLVANARNTAEGAVHGGLPVPGLLDTGAAETVADEALTGKSGSRASTQSADSAQVWAGEAAQSGAMALGATGLMGALYWAKNALALAGSRFLVAPLFSRIDKNDMLENEGRELLHTLIRANPGVSLSELSERSGLGWGTTVYHLGRLEQAGFVASMRQGQSRHFFEKGHAAAQQKTAIAVLKNETAGNVARFLVARPGATQSTIGKALGIKPPVVTKYVKRLAGEGLVNVAADGRSKVVTPTSELSSALLHLDTPAGTMGVSDPALAQQATAPLAA